MSFMYNPYPYDDPNAVNPIKVESDIRSAILSGAAAAARELAGSAAKAAGEAGRSIIFIDGYISAPMCLLAELTARALLQSGTKVTLQDNASLYKEERALTDLLLPCLPEDRETDPPLLYGRLFTGGYEGLMRMDQVDALEKRLAEFKKQGSGVMILYGNGCLIDKLRPYADIRVYVDMTQKRTVLNIKSGHAGNLGFKTPQPFNKTLRHAYYIDFEIAGALRGKLIRDRALEYYVAGDGVDNMQLVPFAAYLSVCRALVRYPFRCRPVYIEGVWGGFYVKHLRNLPDAMRNCAWVFDLIPMEVSIVADMDGLQLEMPYYGFVQTVGGELMGETCLQKFDGYFPIRFNYDDTFHASGNMSIQCHPDSNYVRSNNGELGRQDESYYIVVSGQEAKTYCGFQNGCDVSEFITEIKRSELEAVPIDHDKYVYAEPSKPGMQFLIPAGTIHASGRNQVILEIGSLTIGSYTYKLYDYLRKDLDGKPRPIHSYHGERVLRRERNADWVHENLIQQPRIVRETEEGREIIVGEHDLLYFTLRNLCFEKRMTDETKDRFHVLVLVEGEQVLIRSLSDPSRFFVQRYLDMVVVPASFGKYEVINQGVGSIVLHKTMLRNGYEDIER
jgi:mannose-6-phosphate isomerase class I